MKIFSFSSIFFRVFLGAFAFWIIEAIVGSWPAGFFSAAIHHPISMPQIGAIIGAFVYLIEFITNKQQPSSE